jgi:hypothetical protein
LDPSTDTFDVLEDRPVIEADQRDLDACRAEEVELPGVRGCRIDPDERPDTDPKAGQRQGRVRRRAAEAPAARIVGREVAGGGTDDHRG